MFFFPLVVLFRFVSISVSIPYRDITTKRGKNLGNRRRIVSIPYRHLTTQAKEEKLSRDTYLFQSLIGT